MHERHQHLLDTLVREYVRTGHPVSSQTIAALPGVDLSSASVRNLLVELDQAGYIEQPHVSAGRIPTDKGYRHFIDQHLVAETTERDVRTVRSAFKVQRQAPGSVMRHTVRFLSHRTSAAAATGAVETYEIQESGLHELFNTIEEEQVAAIREAATFLSHLEEYIDVLAGQPGTTVYVGRENPFLPTEHISVITRTATSHNRKSVVLTLVGPKRMTYQRNVALLNAVATLFSQEDI